MHSDPPETGRILVVEGGSGTGKTTFVQSLARQKTVVVIPELPEFIRSLWVRPGDSDTWETNLIPMLDGGLIRLRAASQFSELGYDVVLDRSLLSPLAIVSSIQEDPDAGFAQLRSRCVTFGSHIPPVKVDMVLLDPPPHIWAERLRSHPKAKGYWGSMSTQLYQQDFFRRLWALGEGSQVEEHDNFPRGALKLSGDFSQIYRLACALLGS